MHIKSVEIDGFKSYARKQVVGEFDKQFNAITGLNGSGKSNILDSICFVLGITNLTYIRAKDNNELIYKSGSGGITKAVVRITFDNTGARRFANQPDLVTITRTISISSATAKGSNTYTVCGSNASSSSVADMFRSVGLNVNNPHFLIMQGRITKVLNMKPVEILGMIEEAAGTKQYDQKRNQALANMEKKDQKIEDIRLLMEDEIMPTVQRMKDDREEYLKYTKYERDIQVFKRKQTAFLYDRALKKAIQCENEVAANEEEKEREKEEIAQIEKTIETLQENQKDIEKNEMDELDKEGAELDKEIQKRRDVLTDRDAKHLDIQSAIDDLNAKATRAEGTKGGDTKALAKLEEDLKKNENELGGEEQRGTEMEAEIKATKAKLLALEQGMTTNDAGEMVTLESQITESRTRLTEITTEVKTLDVRKRELEKKKGEKERELARYEKDDKEFTETRGKLEDDMKKLNAEMVKMKFDEDEFEKNKTEFDRVKNEIVEMEKKVDRLDRHIRSKEAQYKDVAGVDRSKDVLGMVPRFMKLKDMDSRPAVEMLLGNHSSVSVVRTSKVAVELMNKKAFTRRTTCYPIDGDDNETNDARDRRDRMLRFAQSLAPRGERVDYAIDLVDFDPKYAYVCRNAIGFAFICDTKETANTLATHKDVSGRVLTRDAEYDFKGKGIASGGAAKAPAGSIDLRETNEWHELRDALEKKRPQCKQLEKMVADADDKARRFKKMKDTLAQYEGKMEEMREKFKFSAAATIRADVDAINAELPDVDGKLKEHSGEIKELKEKITQFEERKKNEKAFADKEKADWQKKLDKLVAEQKKAKGGFEKAKNTLAAMRSEISALTQSIKDGEEAIVKWRAELKKMSDDGRKMEGEKEEAAKEVDIWIKKRDENNHKKKKHQKEIDEMKKDVDKAQKEIKVKQNRLEELDREITRIAESAVSWKEEAKKEKKSNPWISEAKEYFGQKGTDYDFTGYNPQVSAKRIEEMEADMKKMNSHINVNTMNMLAPSEERVLALQKKRAQIEKDKAKLKETIERLDAKKKVELIAAYKSVNKDFNAIFSTLLPGTSAKLDAADGKDPLNGTEIKVAFNDQWKESLGELSGGQRSLVALSLVLAMLKFRPAPLYILDEVDAALDMSHTQNIGAMIKTHFKESQFIIVSLKNGMFENANIIFRTSFVDGTSNVLRTENNR